MSAEHLKREHVGCQVTPEHLGTSSPPLIRLVWSKTHKCNSSRADQNRKKRQPLPLPSVEKQSRICQHCNIYTSTSTLLTDKTLQHHISIKFISINYKYKKYNIIFQGDKI